LELSDPIEVIVRGKLCIIASPAHDALKGAVYLGLRQPDRHL